jgi:cyclophilin family peptidyl-prolyl cis-trans isomerase
MSKRTRRKAGKKSAPSRGAAPPPAERAPAFPWRHPLAWALLGGGLVLGVVLWLRFGGGPAAGPARPADTPGPQAKGGKGPDVPPPEKQPAEKAKDPGDTFLDVFGKKDGSDAEPAGGLLTNAEMEKKVQVLLDLKDRRLATEEELKTAQRKGDRKAFQDAAKERARLVAEFEGRLGPIDRELREARKARPDDAVLEWLSGEVLLLIDGAAEQMLPRFRRAIERGVTRPRAFASLSRAEVRAGHPDEAFRSAAKALDRGGNDLYAWNAFTRAAFNTERYAEVITRLDKAFPKDAPAWAAEMRREAVAREALWQAELKRRAADKQRDDLPRVRFTIEHRRFARGEGGVTLTKVESTGKGEVVLELFEDQAPATVANFLSLVEGKVYDGTRFFAAAPATLVMGGDPKSKEGDPKDDGLNGPGYAIPDEFDRPDARRHFRGSIAMARTGPNTAGSQFFITLSPPGDEMDGHFTVFGRVVQGQEVVDRITLGRTNKQVGLPGRIIPGDLLVRAEVLRKRPHEYKVIKVQPK